jgi:hypothetical protein
MRFKKSLLFLFFIFLIICSLFVVKTPLVDSSMLNNSVKSVEPIPINDSVVISKPVDTGWVYPKYTTNDNSIIAQETSYSCTENSLQLCIYGITGTVFSESHLGALMDTCSEGVDAYYMMKVTPEISNYIGQPISITMETLSLDQVANYISNGNTVMQRIVRSQGNGHMQAIRCVNPVTKEYQVYTTGYDGTGISTRSYSECQSNLYFVVSS